MAKDERRYIIQSITRALELLEVFSIEEPELNLTDISRRLDLNPSTTFRVLVTLHARGYVEQNPDNRKYRLGAACLGLGGVFLSQSDIRTQALLVLRNLRDDCKETVHLGVLAGPEVVYLEKLDPLQPIGFMGSRIGGRVPAHCTALGKAMLAYKTEAEVRQLYAGPDLPRLTPNTITDLEELLCELGRIRRCGYALDDEENEPGVTCVAVPVRDYAQNAVNAISVSGPTARIGHAIVEQGLIARVKEAGQAISSRLGRAAS